MPRIYFQHFSYEPEDASSFYEAIGRVVVLWGRLEAVIDATMLRILAHPEVTFDFPKEMPIALKRKLQLWDKIFTREATVIELKNRALAFSKAVKPVARRRHDLIHAAIGEFYPGRPEGVDAEIIRHDSAGTTLRTFNLVRSDLENLANDIVHLHNIIGPIATVCLIRSAAAERRVARSSEQQASANKETPDP